MSRDDVAERPGDVLDVENRPSTAPNDIVVTTMEQQAMAMDSAMKGKYFRYPLNDIPAQQWPLFLIESVVVDDIYLMGVMNMIPHIIVTYFDPRRRKPTRNFEWSLLSEVSAWLTATPSCIQQHGLNNPNVITTLNMMFNPNLTISCETRRRVFEAIDAMFRPVSINFERVNSTIDFAVDCGRGYQFDEIVRALGEAETACSYILRQVPRDRGMPPSPLAVQSVVGEYMDEMKIALQSALADNEFMQSLNTGGNVYIRRRRRRLGPTREWRITT